MRNGARPNVTLLFDGTFLSLPGDAIGTKCNDDVIFVKSGSMRQSIVRRVYVCCVLSRAAFDERDSELVGEGSTTTGSM